MCMCVTRVAISAGGCVCSSFSSSLSSSSDVCLSRSTNASAPKRSVSSGCKKRKSRMERGREREKSAGQEDRAALSTLTDTCTHTNTHHYYTPNLLLSVYLNSFQSVCFGSYTFTKVKLNPFPFSVFFSNDKLTYKYNHHHIIDQMLLIIVKCCVPIRILSVLNSILK